MAIWKGMYSVDIFIRIQVAQEERSCHVISWAEFTCKCLCSYRQTVQSCWLGCNSFWPKGIWKELRSKRIHSFLRETSSSKFGFFRKRERLLWGETGAKTGTKRVTSFPVWVKLGRADFNGSCYLVEGENCWIDVDVSFD